MCAGLSIRGSHIPGAGSESESLIARPGLLRGESGRHDRGRSCRQHRQVDIRVVEVHSPREDGRTFPQHIWTGSLQIDY